MRSNSVKIWSATLALIAGTLIALSPLGTALDNLAYDFNFAFKKQSATNNEVLIVAIDEPSFQELERPWPWPRSTHANLLSSLFDAGASVVALDLIFADPSVNDEELVQALDKHGPVVLATNAERQSSELFDRIIHVQPLPKFQSENVVLGSAALPIDTDGFVRRFGSKGIGGEDSLASAAVNSFRANASKVIENNDTNTDAINFMGAPGTVPQVSYYQALNPDRYLPKEFLKDKLVFVGLITQSQILNQAPARDSYQTPHTRWGAEYMNGVEIHAQAAQSLLDNSQIKPLSGGWLLVSSSLLAAIATWGMFRFNPIRAALPAIAIGVLVVALCYWLTSTQNLYVSWPLLLLPAMAISIISPLVHLLSTQQERNFIYKAFSSYMAAPIVEQLMDNPKLLKSGGSIREGSVLFLDLQGFTSMSEKMEPEAVLEMLNKYLGDLSDIAIDEGGLIDKFIGDAIMVVWGTPIDDPMHANHACRAAIKMQNYLAQARVNDVSAQNLYARIGIHSGEFVAGNVGGKRKFDYTVIGDTVNLAARLESANNQFNTEILISHATRENHIQDDFTTKQLDTIQVKGRDQEVLVYELVCPS